MAKKSPDDSSLSAREEREMLDVFRESFQHDFPNPKRIGCPGSQVLRALAWRRKLNKPDTVITHIANCSPCFQEHRVFLQEYKSRQKLYRLVAAAVLIVGAGVWLSWGFIGNRGTGVPEPPAIVKTPPPASPASPAPDGTSGQVQVALLDLQHRSVPRGGGGTDTKDLVLPRRPLKLSVHLPIGSQEGEYELQIRDQQKHAVVSAKATARILNYINTLTVSVDTRQVSAGKYQLAIRQAGLDWSQYPLVVK